ncbi:MAG: hypothetical protein AB7D57_10805, partial [Desulfovibrionaceae bacterium]
MPGPKDDDVAAAALGFDLSSPDYRPTPSSTGAASARAHGAAYAAAQAATRASASSSTSSTASSAAGRLRTRTFGFSLGSFGLTYTSRDLELDPDRTGSDQMDQTDQPGWSDSDRPGTAQAVQTDQARNALQSASLLSGTLQSGTLQPVTKTAFLDELDTAVLRQNLADATRRAPNTSAPARGAEAYARMAT